MFNLHTHQSQNEQHTEIVNVYPWEFHQNNQYLSIGIHPWYIANDQIDLHLKIMEEQMNNPKFIAIGECGLDKRITIPFELQVEVFSKQLLMAEHYKKPVIIHCVHAYQEVMALKKSLKISIPMVLHGYSKGLQLADELINKGFYLSFGKYLILNDELAEVLKNIPSDKFFLETDNSQFTLKEVYQKASVILNLNENKLAEMQIKNFENVFLQK